MHEREPQNEREKNGEWFYSGVLIVVKLYSYIEFSCRTTNTDTSLGWPRILFNNQYYILSIINTNFAKI